MTDLSGQVAVVTGSGRGIGRAIAIALGERGCRLVVNYRSGAERAAVVQADLEALGVEVISVQADVSRAEEAQRLIDRALEAYGAVDILVSNAGITRDNILMRMSEEDWCAVLDTNLTGAFHCIKAVQRPMLRRRSGRIITIGSVVGLLGNVGQANYAAAKAGLVGLTKSVARELGSRGITANLVAPGFIDTEMTASLPEAVLQQALSRVALGRIGRPEDVAAAVTFLASDAAAYITGQVLCVDGGMAF
jgi:3-oxoacyl-[acyl-carrier protein] reductase